MKFDKFGNAVYNENDLMELIYQDKIEFIEQVISEPNIKMDGFKLKNIDETFYNISIEDFDSIPEYINVEGPNQLIV